MKLRVPNNYLITIPICFHVIIDTFYQKIIKFKKNEKIIFNINKMLIWLKAIFWFNQINLNSTNVS